MHFKKLHEAGRALLKSYFTLKMTTKDIFQHYLQEFEIINAALQKHNGRSIRNIIHFEHDRNNLRKLPQTLTVYRGFREDEKRDGISFSMSRRIAEGFAHDAGLAGLPDGEISRRIRIGTLNGKVFYGNAYTREKANLLPALLIVGECDIEDALAYTNIRQEQEIVINPAKVRNIVELTPTAKHIVLPTEGFQVTAEPLEWLLATRQH